MLVISYTDHHKSGQCQIFAIFNEDFKCFNDFVIHCINRKLESNYIKCRNITLCCKIVVYSSREWMAVILIVFIRPHHMLLLHLFSFGRCFVGKCVRPPCRCFAHRTFLVACSDSLHEHFSRFDCSAHLMFHCGGQQHTAKYI